LLLAGCGLQWENFSFDYLFVAVEKAPAVFENGECAEVRVINELRAVRAQVRYSVQKTEEFRETATVTSFPIDSIQFAAHLYSLPGDVEVGAAAPVDVTTPTAPGEAAILKVAPGPDAAGMPSYFEFEMKLEAIDLSDAGMMFFLKTDYHGRLECGYRYALSLYNSQDFPESVPEGAVELRTVVNTGKVTGETPPF
jgi:hypothetical protein